jgi:hypothetical protein
MGQVLLLTLPPRGRQSCGQHPMTYRPVKRNVGGAQSTAANAFAVPVIRAIKARFGLPSRATARVMFCAWTSSPTKSRDFFMVCMMLVGSFIGDAAPTLIPSQRLCTALPRKPRSGLRIKRTALLSQTRCASTEASHKVEASLRVR